MRDSASMGPNGVTGERLLGLFLGIRQPDLHENWQADRETRARHFDANPVTACLHLP